MIITATKFVNARTPADDGQPSVRLHNPYYLLPNQTLEVVDVVIGQEYRGSAIWYKGKDGQYYWSGGFSETKFQLSSVIFDNLDNASKLLVLKECVIVLFDYYKKKIGTEFTGLGLSYKHTESAGYTDKLCLTIQVNKKNSNATFQVAPIEYKGFLVPTDVEEASFAEAISQGESMSRMGSGNRGTVGFYLSEGDEHLLITNYHVVADDFLKQNPPRKSFSSSGTQYPIRVPFDGKEVVGYFVKGTLDWLADVGVVRLKAQGQNQFTPNGIMPFKDIETEFQRLGQGGIGVSMRGGVSSNKPMIIWGLYAKLEINYFNQFKHTISGLIKLKKRTKPGDSGSPINYQDKLVGIIVAEDDKFSYAIPIDSIMAKIKSP